MTGLIDLIYAHPYPQRSRANRALLDAVEGLSFVRLRSLYDLYPDFSIDVAAEQRALSEAKVIVWQHPLYWYSVPALMKLWFDKVLAYGWAYGDDAHALAGKPCQWVVTTGADEEGFTPGGMHGNAFERFVPPVEQTARFCRMAWLSPFVVHGARRVSDEALQASAQAYRSHLTSLAQAFGTVNGNGE